MSQSNRDAKAHGAHETPEVRRSTRRCRASAGPSPRLPSTGLDADPPFRISGDVSHTPPVKIYTKAGDAGQTGLVDGSRVGKADPRVAAYGDVDELMAALGVVRAHVTGGTLGSLLDAIQRDLFAVGAQLADPSARVAARKAKAAIPPDRVAALEAAIDEREGGMPPLRAFLLPGGTPLAAFLHVARTVCRRAERGVVALSHAAEIDPAIVVYLNRLSDLLFVLARHENLRAGLPEERW
jgi:cob(I)alamin adenosyltransferase